MQGWEFFLFFLVSSFLSDICFPAFLSLFSIFFFVSLDFFSLFLFRTHQPKTQIKRHTGVVKCQEVAFFKEQRPTIKAVLHNPSINKRISLTDMSPHIQIIASNCLIWDFQICSCQN